MCPALCQNGPHASHTIPPPTSLSLSLPFLSSSPLSPNPPMRFITDEPCSQHPADEATHPSSPPTAPPPGAAPVGSELRRRHLVQVLVDRPDHPGGARQATSAVAGTMDARTRRPAAPCSTIYLIEQQRIPSNSACSQFDLEDKDAFVLAVLYQEQERRRNT
jgi:hypothetical protein